MVRPLKENPRTVADNDEELQRKRKSHEMSEICVVMGSSNSREQELLEAAAFQLIILSNPVQQSYDYTKAYDIDGCFGNNGSPGGKKKKKQNHEGEGLVKQSSDKESKVTSSSSSSSSGETVKSGISGVSMEEKEVEVEKRRAPRLQENRWRSILDIYDVTTPL